MTTAIKMNNFLLDKIDNSKYIINFNKLFKCDDASDTSKPYFFLINELNVRNVVQYNQAKQLGKIRHVIAYKGKWFDYIVKREFNTLNEWAIDAGGTINEVLFGVNRVHELDHNKSTYDKRVYQTPVFVTLKALLDRLGYVHPPTVEIPTYKPFNTFTDIAKELKILDEPNTFRWLVYNPKNDTIISALLVEETNCGVEDPVSQMCLVIQQDNHYSNKLYSSISELPEGSEVYFRNTGDRIFHSIKKVLNIQ